MKATTKLLNAYLTKFANVELVRGAGYYYLSAIDAARPSLVDDLRTTMILCPALNRASLAWWVDEIETLAAQAKR